MFYIIIYFCLIYLFIYLFIIILVTEVLGKLNWMAAKTFNTIQ